MTEDIQYTEMPWVEEIKALKDHVNKLESWKEDVDTDILLEREHHDKNSEASLSERIDQLESSFADLAAQLSNAYQNLQDTVLLLNLSETALTLRLQQGLPITLDAVQKDRTKLLQEEREKFKQRQRKEQDEAAARRSIDTQ